MLERKITKKLLNWYEKKDKKSLIIEGARQVGKTYIVKKFLQDQCKNHYIEINFLLDERARDIFEDDISMESLYVKLSVLYRDIFEHNKRVILFLDEIQSCPKAITALKSFTMDDRIDVIASGSLLGIHYHLSESFPVGYVERITLYPLDFEEYLWAIKHHDTVNIITNYFHKKQSVPTVIHNEMMKHFKNYIVIGGMPEVVKNFIEYENYTRVLGIQNQILTDYQDDIAKYGNAQSKVRAREVFDSIPFQLGKDNKKFQYKYVSKGGRSTMYEASIQWLIDAGLCYKCHALSHLEIPHPAYKRVDAFKLYVMDTGLLVAMFGIDAQTSIILDNLRIAKGAIYENVIAIILKQNNFPLYYYEKDNRLEIDFIISKNTQTQAIEVKSSDNTKSKSLDTLLAQQKIKYGIKLSAQNLNSSESILRLPLYMAFLI